MNVLLFMLNVRPICEEEPRDLMGVGAQVCEWCRVGECSVTFYDALWVCISKGSGGSCLGEYNVEYV